MRNVFISFLGTNDYLACNYLIKGYEPVLDVRFVQEACIARWCHQWNTEDRIFICATGESEKNNWQDDGHKDKDGNSLARQGLASRLRGLNLTASVEKVMIPPGKSEEEIWDIFEEVFSLLEEGDVLYLDITHAFRSLPMLAMVILSYAKVMRNISVRAISYGAMEALGSLDKVRKMKIEKRNVPVFDLLPFDQLQDWIIAVDRFTATGDGKMIKRMADENVAPILKETKGQDACAADIKKLGKCLADFSSVIATCRGLYISASANSLREVLQKVENQSLIKPLKPLLHKLEPAIAPFNGDEITDGLAAARWCLDHDLYQQGYTILQETIITYILISATGLNGRDKGDREIVLQAVTILINELPEECWKEAALKKKPTTEKIITWMQPQEDLVKIMRNISNIRNDLNHSGQNRGSMKPGVICSQLKDYISQLEEIVQRNRG